MIAEATLYLATPEDARTALLRVGGCPVAFRVLAAALRAGCRRVAVPASFRGTDVERAIRASPRARAAIVWLDGDDAEPRGPTVLLPAAALASSVDLQRLLRAEPTTTLGPPGTHAPLVVADADLVQSLWPAMRADRPLAATLERLLAARDARREAGQWYVHVSDVGQARRAETLLYAGLGSPIDTPLDRVFHRRLSRPITRLAIALGVTPNQISVLSLVVGLLAVWGFWHATPLSALLGLAGYGLAVVLDHSDGEVARLTLSESALGEWLDVANDTLIHALTVLAMGVTTQATAGRAGLGLGALATVGVVGSAMVAKTSPRSAGGGLGGVLDALGSRDGFYAMLVLFIAALTVAPGLLPALMVLAAGGSHAYWLTRLGYRLCARGAERALPLNTVRKPK